MLFLSFLDNLYYKMHMHLKKEKKKDVDNFEIDHKECMLILGEGCCSP